MADTITLLENGTQGVDHAEETAVALEVVQETTDTSVNPTSEKNAEAENGTTEETKVDSVPEKEDDKSSSEEDDDSETEETPLIPEVKKLDFEHFKNRYSGKDGRSAIEVLETGSNFASEFRQLDFMRKSRRMLRTPEERKKKPVTRATPLVAAGKADQKLIQRVRIQSPKIMHHMTAITEESGGTVPITFMRPFRVLIYFQPRMKEILAKLENRWPDTPEGNDSGKDDENRTPVIDESDGDFNGDAGENPEMYDVESLRLMRCYVDFVDKDIMPLYSMFTQPDTPLTKVRFTDLWLLFRFGELVYASENSDISPRHGYGRDSDSGSTQSTLVWRVYSITCPAYKPVYPTPASSRKPRAQSTDSQSFCVWAYYIDFDGVSYGPVKHAFHIKPFEGEIDIRLLPCFPIRYVQDPHLLGTLTEEGAKFKDCVEKRHLSYEGWTAALTPTGQQITIDEQESLVKYPEYVESHVIIDFLETFKVYPFWQPQFHNPAIYDDEAWDEDEDKCNILQWDKDKFSDDYIQITDGVAAWQRKDSLENDAFIKAYKAYLGSTGKEKKAVELRKEDYVLLPKRLFTYVLRDRKFAPVDVRFLQVIQKQQNAFKGLKISEDYKNIVKGLVSSHFVSKDVERKFAAFSITEKANMMQGLTFPGGMAGQMGLQDGKTSAEANSSLSTVTNIQGITQDLIQGKGRGLVVLLHGVPGVGKTATAEAVALEYQKPLFVITCGDLGLTPSDVERHLTEVFRLAHLWDCVLLLDEADVFLSSRDNLDLNRNALVSVFLRVLEYYSGVLFLTTNRVGHLDEAFKSRIHVSLCYDKLTKKQARAIFEMNISRLNEIAVVRSTITQEPKLEIQSKSILEFAEALFDRSEQERNWIPWNGRQIRNAFQIASSLAYNKMYIDSEKAKQAGNKDAEQQVLAPRLNGSHFKVISNVVDDFENYMLQTRGQSSHQLALARGERADRRKKETTNFGLSSFGFPESEKSSGSAAKTRGYNRDNMPRTPDSRPPGRDTPGMRFDARQDDYRGRGEDYGRDGERRYRQSSPDYGQDRGYYEEEKQSSNRRPYDSRDRYEYDDKPTRPVPPSSAFSQRSFDGRSSSPRPRQENGGFRNDDRDEYF